MFLSIKEMARTRSSCIFATEPGLSKQTQHNCIPFLHRLPNVFDVVPTLYKCYTNVLCLVGNETHMDLCAVFAV